MQSRRIAEVLNFSDNKEKNLNSSLSDNHQQVQNDSSSALQQYLDRIPISAISGITDSLVLEVEAGDSVRDAVHMLYEKDIIGASIVDVLDPESDTAGIRFSDQYIGFIDFPSIVLWCLEEFEKMRKNATETHVKDVENDGFFSILDKIPQIGQTKVGELAKSFLWEPFFPVRLDDTILHALLLLSKHRLQVLPVIQKPAQNLIGFVTQNALVQLLLQSRELEWFDNIADKKLSDFRLEDQEPLRSVYGNQTVADALKLLWQNQTCAVAVVEPQTKKLLGNVRNIDIYHIVKNDDLLRNSRILTVEEFIHIETEVTTTEHNRKANLESARSLRMKNGFTTRMDSPVTNKENDTLKQIMEHMIETNSSFSFVVNDNEQVTGFVTMRGMILQFAPPCVNSRINGGGFFEFALEQSGCQVKNGSMIRKR